MCLNDSLLITLQNHLLSFLICAFQSLDNGLVRKECAPLVSISIWCNLASEAARNRKFESNPHLKKAWRASAKRYDGADEQTQARLRFERSWLYSMILNFVRHLQNVSEGLLTSRLRRSRLMEKTEAVIYCERFLEFLSDLESQLLKHIRATASD